MKKMSSAVTALLGAALLLSACSSRGSVRYRRRPGRRTAEGHSRGAN